MCAALFFVTTRRPHRIVDLRLVFLVMCGQHRIGGPAMIEEFIRSTCAWVISILGMVGSAMAVVSIIKRGFSIDLSATPAIIYDGYVRYRDFVFSMIPFRLPASAKDVIALYLLLAASFLQAFEAGLGNRGGKVGLPVRILFFLGWPFGVAYMLSGIDPWYADDWRDATRFARSFVSAILTIVAATIFFFWWNHLSQGT